MKNRIVIWGTDNTDARVLIAMELLTDNNRVDLYVIPEAEVSNDLDEAMHQKWRLGESIEMPESAQKRSFELSLTENLLPDDLKTDRTDLVMRAQSEWHFAVLSSKLYQSYRSELDHIQTQIENLASYSNDVWLSLKEYWDKVLGQVKERNLMREQADSLKESVNNLFGVLKDRRSEVEDQFKRESQELHDGLLKRLVEIENRINSNGRFKSIFDDLKNFQNDYRNTKLTREHNNSLWDRIDKAFKAAKERKFGDAPEAATGSERIERRLEGLLSAIGKMQDSIDRDRKDLEYERKKINSTEGQLEAQIRQVKLTMIESRVASKEEKLREMLDTRDDIERKMEQIRQRELRQQEKEKAEKRIADEIKQRAEPKDKPAADNVETPAPEVAEVPAIEFADTPAAEAPAAVEPASEVVEAPAAEEPAAEVVETAVTEEPAAEVVEATAAEVVETAVTEELASEVVEAPVSDNPAAEVIETEATPSTDTLPQSAADIVSDVVKSVE
jgi:hypothetical protein